MLLLFNKSHPSTFIFKHLGVSLRRTEDSKDIIIVLWLCWFIFKMVKNITMSISPEYVYQRKRTIHSEARKEIEREKRKRARAREISRIGSNLFFFPFSPATIASPAIRKYIPSLFFSSASSSFLLFLPARRGKQINLATRLIVRPA